MEQILQAINAVGFPIVCVLGLAWYAKDTTTKIIGLTEKVTNALVTSNNVIKDNAETMKDIKAVLAHLLEKE